MSTQDQTICGDCYEGRCHGDPGRCGCMLHPVSVRAREAAESTPALADTTTPAITDEAIEAARDVFEEKFSIGISDDYLPSFREAIETATAGVLAERDALAAEVERLRSALDEVEREGLEALRAARALHDLTDDQNQGK